MWLNTIGLVDENSAAAGCGAKMQRCLNIRFQKLKRYDDFFLHFNKNNFNGHELPQDKFKTVGSKLNLLKLK